MSLAGRTGFLTEKGRLVPEILPDSRVLLTDTPIYQQLAPDSPLLAELNRPGALPPEIECHTFYGDIRVRLRVTAGKLKLIEQAVSFGDLVVPAASASTIPGAQATPHPYITEKTLELSLRRRPEETATRSLYAFLPDTSHGRLLSNPDVHDGVLALLND